MVEIKQRSTFVKGCLWDPTKKTLLVATPEAILPGGEYFFK
jgi:hypothetical protein